MCAAARQQVRRRTETANAKVRGGTRMQAGFRLVQLRSCIFAAAQLHFRSCDVSLE